jgi:flagellar hook-associated protein 1
MSNFSALNTGLSALIAHRQVAETISHNIANVNTPGYSRQRVELQAAGGAPVPSIYARPMAGGTGVNSEGIIRIRDAFLEAQHRSETAVGATLRATAAVLGRLEGAFPEPSGTGIASQLNELWASWQSVVNNPESEALRTNVLEKGRTVIQAFQLADRQVRTQRADAVANIGLMVNETNELAGQIATLNGAIQAATLVGQTPNDLLDQRDQLTLRLTELSGATVESGANNTVDVYIGGRALVHGQRTQALAVAEVDDPALTGVGLKRVEVRWAGDDYPATVSSGSMAGFVSGANEILPRYLRELDGVAAQLVTSVNDLHTAGKGLDGVDGRNFFDPTGVTAATLALSTDVAGQPRNLAAAGPGGGPLDTSNAELISLIGRAPDGPDAGYRSLIVGLGSEVKFFRQQSDVQHAVVARLDADRSAVSGVNLDEEMVNLVAAQHAYSAAARVITTIDQMLDTLINRTGLVGR